MIARTLASVGACHPREIIVAAGALATTGDTLWFLHADTTAPPHAIGAIETALETSSRRFEKGAALAMWSRWVGFQLAWWAGVSPERLAHWYERKEMKPVAEL